MTGPDRGARHRPFDVGQCSPGARRGGPTERGRARWPKSLWAAVAVPSRSMTADMGSFGALASMVRNDLGKVLRYAAVSVVTVPIGLVLLWYFLAVLEMSWVQGNVLSVVISTIPNYLLNRYWVWNKRGPNSVQREIAPFWIMALLGALISTGLIRLAQAFTDEVFVALALQFISFGVVWVLKYFVIERYLFGDESVSSDSHGSGEMVESAT